MHLNLRFYYILHQLLAIVCAFTYVTKHRFESKSRLEHRTMNYYKYIIPAPESYSTPK